MALVLGKIESLFFMACVRRGFAAGFRDFNPNALVDHFAMALTLTEVPLWRRLALIFLPELHGDFTTMRLIKWSSRVVVHQGLPLLFLSEKLEAGGLIFHQSLLYCFFAIRKLH